MALSNHAGVIYVIIFVVLLLKLMKAGIAELLHPLPTHFAFINAYYSIVNTVCIMNKAFTFLPQYKTEYSVAPLKQQDFKQRTRIHTQRLVNTLQTTGLFYNQTSML